MGPLTYFLGLEVSRDAKGLHLSQRWYILDVLERVNMLDAKSVQTPMSPTPKLNMHTGTPLADALNKLSQYMHSPTDAHWSAVKRILRYLTGTPERGLYFCANSCLQLHAFSDADWASDLDDFISTNAYVVYLGSTPISWSSKQQKGVARSSTEAEYRAVVNAVSEVRWILSLLTELKVHLHSTPDIYCDNMGATYLCANPVFHSRMKHIALDYHFVRQNIRSGALRVAYVSTHDQLADTLTKPLSRP